MKPRRALAWIATAVALGLVVLAYRHPLVLRQLSDQVWSCFG